eukprot:Nk52_evm9s2133 gene=Nk52_evmTU9s2133
MPVDDMENKLTSLAKGLPLDPLPEKTVFAKGTATAPRRNPKLTKEVTRLALKNSLRYIPKELHAKLAPEFLEELKEHGHIYMRRLQNCEGRGYEMKAHPYEKYPAKCKQAAAIMHMIQNNLNPDVAQFPNELVTYGGNGSVFSNWAQYHLTMKYLSELTEEQTLILYSGHPLGLFPSHPDAPRLVITNGMVIPNYSTKEDYEQMYATCVSQYGQMTAGSFCYIGPQGIVHGTTLTLLNAGRKYLGNADLSGKVFVTAGLGGMSGAQPKAGVICGSICVCAEVSPEALEKRYRQGWIQEKEVDIISLIARIKKARADKITVSIGFLGNVVDIWEALAKEEELLVELGSDQTSCHNPFNGGYYPVGYTFDEANEIMKNDPPRFKELVQESLRRHVKAINNLTSRGMKFWDYGNSFLLEAGRAGAEIFKDESKSCFRYPSYVEDIMGDIFSLGFGPFRWVCTSGKHEDLQLTDQIAAEVITSQMKDAPPRVKSQHEDNYLWISEVEKHKLVVGSEARILYSDEQGRIALANAFNNAVAEGRLAGPVVLSRDHHDVSGTDSPWRETSHIRDGSMFCADMAIHNVIGDSFRGATWVSIHNGGGTGWGEAINGGFGMVLDGTDDAARRAASMLEWDVNNGIARRAWAGVDNANFQIKRAMEANDKLKVTIPENADDTLLDSLC